MGTHPLDSRDMEKTCHRGDRLADRVFQNYDSRFGNEPHAAMDVITIL